MKEKILIAVVAGGLVFGFMKYNSSDTFNPPSQMRNLPITNSATCRFERIDEVIYKGKDDILEDPLKGRIEFSSHTQKEPVIITFVDLDTDKPKLKGNNGQGDLLVAYNDDDQIVLIEEGILNVGTFHNFTIFKKEGVAIWNKQYKIIALPYGSTSMGYCE
jgi:hypothetical protein